MLSQLDGKVSLLSVWAVVSIYVGVLLLIVLIAAIKRWLTLSGLIGAFVQGFIVLYLGGFSAFSIFLFFFVSCSVLSKLKRSYNRREAKGSRRDIMQVMANGLPAVLALFLTRTPQFYSIAIVGFSASMAEAMADTWASTFGIMSRKDPVSIVTFTRVPRGISGGVTLLGLLSGALGAVLISLLHVLVINPDWHEALVISGAGFLGCIIDSVLGATVQEHFRAPDGTLTEKEYGSEGRNPRERGVPGFDNDAVNLTSGLLSLSFSLLIMTIVR